MMDKELINLIKDDVFQCAVVPTSALDFSMEVRNACKANYCGNYNKRWTCPPVVGEVEELKAKCMKYNNALVFTTKGDLEDSFDFEGMMKARDYHENVERMVYKKVNIKDSLLLGPGGCSLCPTCNYPEPCRHPDKIILPMEACGISVVDLAYKANINYHNGPNTVTYFSSILY